MFRKKEKIAKQVERDILIPGIDRALNIAQTLGYQFNLKRVTRGEISYFTHRQVKDRLAGMPYDIVIWGHVLPQGDNEDYNVHLMIFSNPEKIRSCLFYFEAEVRNGRILKWNNTNVDLPESGLATIPSVLSIKLISYLNNSSSYDQVRINRTIRERLIQPISNGVPVESPMNWEPNQDCDAQDLFGSIKFQLRDRQLLQIPLNQRMYLLLEEEIANGIRHNWPLTVESPTQLLAANRRSKLPLLVGTTLVVAGGVACLAGVCNSYSPPRSKPLRTPPNPPGQ